MFYTNKPKFDSLPLQFGSHREYRDTWIPLFLFEVFSSMINQNCYDSRDKEIAKLQGVKYREKNTYFEGFIQRSHEDQNYVYLKLYEATNNIADKNGNYTLRLIDSLKEFDLLLISDKELGSHEIKKITSM